MKRFKNGSRLSGTVLAVALVLGSASPAQADFEIKFSVGSDSVTFNVDANSGAGQVTISGGTTTNAVVGNFAAQTAFGIFGDNTSGAKEFDLFKKVPGGGIFTIDGFKITATVSDSNSPGTLNVASIDLSSLKIQNLNGSTATLVITTGDTGFTAPKGNPNVALSSTVSATAAGTNSANASVVFNSYLDTTNAQFGTQQGSPTITLNPIAPGASASGNSFAIVDASTTPYSLTQVGQYKLAGGDMFTDGSSGSGVTVPAPAGLVLLLSGVPFLAVGAWRRRSRKQA